MTNREIAMRLTYQGKITFDEGEEFPKEYQNSPEEVMRFVNDIEMELNTIDQMGLLHASIQMAVARIPVDQEKWNDYFGLK